MSQKQKNCNRQRTADDVTTQYYCKQYQLYGIQFKTNSYFYFDLYTKELKVHDDDFNTRKQSSDFTSRKNIGRRAISFGETDIGKGAISLRENMLTDFTYR